MKNKMAGAEKEGYLPSYLLGKLWAIPVRDFN